MPFTIKCRSDVKVKGCKQFAKTKNDFTCILTGAAKYVPRNRAARKTAKYKNFWVVMRQARNIDGCFFIRKYSEINMNSF